MAAISEGSTFKIDWDAIERMSRTVDGGSDGIDWDSLGVPEEEGKNLVGRAVDGVRGFLQKFHLPKFGKGEAEPVEPVEPAEAGRNRFFGWVGEIGQRFNEWRKRPILEIEQPAAPGGETDRFGWLKNTWKWLRGAPGGLVNKFRRQPGAAAIAKISRAERVEALREGTTQFLKNWGPEIAVGLLGGFLGYSTGSIEAMRATGNFAPAVIEMGAILTAGVGATGLIIGDERGPEAIPDVEGRFGRVVTAIRRGLSNKAVRRGLKLVTFGSGGFAIGGIGRLVVEGLQVIQQGAAGAPAPAEVGSPVDIVNVIGDTRREAIEAAQQGLQNAAHAAEVVQQQIATTVSQATDMLTQANSVVGSISPDVVNDPSVQGASEQARQAIEAYNQFSASAAAGGIDVGEAAHLQQLASDAVNAANQAADTARQVIEAAQAAADAEAIRRGVLQGGQVMKDVIAATPSQTVFEALIQQTFQATGSPYSVEAANALSWTLPSGDISSLYQGAIKEGAKTVAALLQQAHDFAAANGGEYTVRAIRQAVTEGRLSQDVLHAVEAANLPAGEGKNQAIQALNTILQGVIK